MILQNGLLSIGSSQNVVVEIVNLLSGAALKAYDGWGAYCSSKASVFNVFLPKDNSVLPPALWHFYTKPLEILNLKTAVFMTFEAFKKLLIDARQFCYLPPSIFRIFA